MKFKFLFLSTFISLNVFGQKDTTVYFSELDCPISTVTDAFHYETFVNEYNGQFSLTQFNKLDNKWKKTSEISIRKLSDTSFSMISYGRTIRIFHKIDSGFIIKDYQNSKLISAGFSKLIFPLIRSGVWKYYNPLTGKKETEYNYLNNQIFSTKYWVNDFTSYGDSVKPGDTSPSFKGGNYAMLMFIYDNVRYPEEAKENDKQGRVIINFLISSQGEIVGPKVMNKVDKSLAIESLRVINLMRGKWIPGKTGSLNSDSFKTIPIVFTLK